MQDRDRGEYFQCSGASQPRPRFANDELTKERQNGQKVQSGSLVIVASLRDFSFATFNFRLPFRVPFVWREMLG